MKPPPLFRFLAATAVIGALGVVAITGLPSCLTTQSYVYTAQKYDPTNDCLEAYAAIETVNGSGANALCAPTCLTVGADLYVSTMCPPLPAIATPLEADAGDCIAALAAAEKGGTCDAPATTDGGEEAGGEDASTEAGEEPEAGPDMDASDDGPFPQDAAEAG